MVSICTAFCLAVIHLAGFQHLVMEGEVVEVANKVISGVAAQQILELGIVKGNVRYVTLGIGNAQLLFVQIGLDRAGLRIVGYGKMVL